MGDRIEHLVYEDWDYRIYVSKDIDCIYIRTEHYSESGVLITELTEELALPIECQDKLVNAIVHGA